MLEIKNNVSLNDLMTENEILKLDKEVNAYKYQPLINHINLLDEPFPEFFINATQDAVMRDILNGKIH